MNLKAYLMACLIRFCHYNNADWLCEILEIYPRSKQLSSEARELLKKKIELLGMNHASESNASGGSSNNFPVFASAVPMPTIKTFFLLPLLLIWGYALNWITNNTKLQRYLKDKGWIQAETLSEDRHLERSIGDPVELSESSGYRSLNISESSFLTTQGFDASFEQILTVAEVQDFASLRILFDVVSCEAIANDTYFLRCQEEKLCLSLIEVSEVPSLNRETSSDLEFFMSIAANGADFANEAHALEVRGIVAVYDSRENLDFSDLNNVLDARRYLAVIHHYEQSVDFRTFRMQHPTAEEITLILEDIATSLRSLTAAAARCGTDIPAQFLIALVSCSHDRRDPRYRDRSFTCLNSLGVSVRLNPLCLRAGIPLDRMFRSVAFLRHRLETEKEDCINTVESIVKDRAIRTCTDLLLILGDLLKFDEEQVRDIIADGSAAPSDNVFSSEHGQLRICRPGYS